MRLLSTLGVVRPDFGEIEPIGDRQTRMMIGDRERHGDLAVVRLAQPPAILPRHADRMRTLLLKPCVVDDPGFDASLHRKRRRCKFANLRQHRLVRPRRLPNKVQQRLMRRRGARRRHHRSDRLDALALAGHQQTGAIIQQRARSVRVPEHARQIVHVSRKPRLALPPRPVHTPGHRPRRAPWFLEPGVRLRTTHKRGERQGTDFSEISISNQETIDVQDRAQTVRGRTPADRTIEGQELPAAREPDDVGHALCRSTTAAQRHAAGARGCRYPVGRAAPARAKSPRERSRPCARGSRVDQRARLLRASADWQGQSRPRRRHKDRGRAILRPYARSLHAHGSSVRRRTARLCGLPSIASARRGSGTSTN